MKKSFISAAVVVLAMSLSAYAQDDYEDYAYEEGVAESAPEGYNAGSKTETKMNQDVATVRGRNDVRKASYVESSTAESFSDPMNKLLRFGAHLGIGVSGTYGSEEVFVSDSYVDPFEGFIGINMDLGGMVSFRFSKLLGVTAEMNLHFVDYMKESDVWTIEVSDEYGKHREPLDENMMFVGIAIPVMARLYPVNVFYLEAGAQLNLNLAGSFTLDNTEYDYSEDMGDWKIEPIGFALNMGGGVVIPSGKGVLEIGARVQLDMTALEQKDQVIWNANNNTSRPSVAAKGWHVQFVCNYLI